MPTRIVIIGRVCGNSSISGSPAQRTSKCRSPLPASSTVSIYIGVHNYYYSCLGVIVGHVVIQTKCTVVYRGAIPHAETPTRTSCSCRFNVLEVQGLPYMCGENDVGLYLLYILAYSYEKRKNNQETEKCLLRILGL